MRHLDGLTRLTFAASLLFFGVRAAEDEKEYRGKYIGKLNTYDNQVSGDVYAVDEYTFLLAKFTYDGTGSDAFFWSGAASRPGPEGFIVPDEYGTTNVLNKYYNKDITVNLPDRKKLTEVKWLAVYDISAQKAFGDVYIPEEFEPPRTQRISRLSKTSRGVSSDSIEIVDSKTIRIKGFSYDGSGKETYFWVGGGPQPSTKGNKVPDDMGYLDRLRKYYDETVILQLPGDLNVFQIDWLSVYDLETKQSFGSVIIPDNLNVPPSLVTVIPHKSSLPNCAQLHKDFQVNWEVFGPQITIELVGQIPEDYYMAFGFSGSTEKSQMIGADLAVAYIDGARGLAIDYNITAKSPCTKVLGRYKGVCKDLVVGGLDDIQYHTSSRTDGITVITYRRSLIPADHGDQTFPGEDTGPIYVVWALGRLDESKEPSFHDFYPKADVKLELGRKDSKKECFDFTRTNNEFLPAWNIDRIFDRTLRTFQATIGPSGGKRGYQGITRRATTGLAWYMNGFLIPELTMKRGLTYLFKVKGGNNPHSAEHYHPLIITDEPAGGYDRLSDDAQKAVRVLAGVEFSRRGQPRPTAAGPLCLAQHSDARDRRLDDDFTDFKKFNRSLVFKCDDGEAASLEVTPNTSWPDVVYYNSFTHPNMGWKIHIIDSFAKSGARTVAPAMTFLLTVTFNYFL
ncbi:protein Skeletor, isoforms B/C isoform X2 [Neocloeon triangulifer]|uniref:protein Skeletor, isoforms B/C isoform X2 n=1 Tax=Neocloeon triangulifer TaxID=2078957 RepID=UPI00286F3035|nr:protein Skeletor, isoforms B/C isoform X2 [Neocloeon triangulifer]